MDLSQSRINPLGIIAANVRPRTENEGSIAALYEWGDEITTDLMDRDFQSDNGQPGPLRRADEAGSGKADEGAQRRSLKVVDGVEGARTG
ncbi:hypothetical protein CLCR_07810 [Cladophialophora carrionii]|uniref:Uncharacterized protein n=1 Tax=Cladophialophora carrionii TaxID=86049 RepID=A0A1C1CNI6_9EURO|nr:hypothetical protein CLCR_07810 [Cladophialophora carrionii]